MLLCTSNGQVLHSSWHSTQFLDSGPTRRHQSDSISRIRRDHSDSPALWSWNIEIGPYLKVVLLKPQLLMLQGSNSSLKSRLPQCFKLHYCKRKVGAILQGVRVLLLGWLHTSAFGCPIKRPARPALSVMCAMCAAAQEISWGIITKPQMTTPHTPLMLLGCSSRDWWIFLMEIWSYFQKDNFGFFISIMALFPRACWICQSSWGFAVDCALTCQSSYYSYPFIHSQDHTRPNFPSLTLMQEVYVCILSPSEHPPTMQTYWWTHTRTLVL